MVRAVVTQDGLCYRDCVTDKTIVKSVRMPAELWAYVAERAKKRDVSPNAWMVRMVQMVRDKKLIEVKAE